ncbi:MAG: outer membrane beta-barrel protein [Gammaproteobacteria bacterium]|nr:outer membrane beta-barrel protein [Gammaproteobacteria bacterium]MDD9815926.1 outer membrane beta-barrel protein [Gammaproteobacteria bacterium]MDD9851985.1 outer membrane beta-barrel protein [Gammaproteobacteria bacterium]
MKNLFMAAFVVAFTFALQPANAQDDVGRWYLGGGIGQSEEDDYCDGSSTLALGSGRITVTNCDGKDTGVKLYGGYHFHENFSVEGGYADFGETKGGGIIDGTFQTSTGSRTFNNDPFTVKEEASSLFGAVVGRINVRPKVTLLGKIGVHRWDYELTPGGAATIPSSDNGVDLFYGIGGEVAPFPNEKIKLRAEYEMFKLDDVNDTADGDISLLSLGLTYTF